MKKRILILPGDEIGPEITTEVIKIIDFLNESKITNILYEFADIGGASLDKYNKPITSDALDKSTKSDAVLLACVGSPKYDNNPWNYKFTWNPRNVVLAAKGQALSLIHI